MAYINHQGKTKSLMVLGLSANLCSFCHSKNNFPIVVHIPGKVDLTPDALSQKIINCSDWRLYPEVFQYLYICGAHKKCLLESWISTQVLNHYSWLPDIQLQAIDTLLKNRSQMKRYINLTWAVARLTGLRYPSAMSEHSNTIRRQNSSCVEYFKQFLILRDFQSQLLAFCWSLSDSLQVTCMEPMGTLTTDQFLEFFIFEFDLGKDYCSLIIPC